MSRLWSAKDLLLLDELWGQVSVATIASRLGRSKTAVQQKGYALHGSPLARNEDVTITELGRSLGIDRKVISLYWVKNHGLPVHKRILLRGRKYNLVNIDEFWTWAKKHQELIDTRRFERGELGKEPSWMDAKRQADAIAKPKAWTRHELFELRRLLGKGLKHREIAAHIGRSEIAVCVKARRLGLHPRRAWTDKDVSELEHLLAERQWSLGEVADKIGRTKKSVQSKMRDLGLHARIWSKQDIRELRRLFTQTSLTIKAIGEKLGRTEGAVNCKIKKLEFSIRR